MFQNSINHKRNNKNGNLIVQMKKKDVKINNIVIYLDTEIIKNLHKYRKKMQFFLQIFRLINMIQSNTKKTFQVLILNIAKDQIQKIKIEYILLTPNKII